MASKRKITRGIHKDACATGSFEAHQAAHLVAAGATKETHLAVVSALAAARDQGDTAPDYMRASPWHCHVCAKLEDDPEVPMVLVTVEV